MSYGNVLPTYAISYIVYAVKARMRLNGILYKVQSTQNIAVRIITANFDHYKTHAPSILKDDSTFCASSNVHPWHNLNPTWTCKLQDTSFSAVLRQGTRKVLLKFIRKQEDTVFKQQKLFLNRHLIPLSLHIQCNTPMALIGITLSNDCRPCR